MEQDTGFEPAPPAWKAGMLAANTNPAEMADQRGGVSPPEKIGTLKKGEKIFSFIPVLILYKNFFEKSTYFLRNHRQYS